MIKNKESLSKRQRCKKQLISKKGTEKCLILKEQRSPFINEQ